MILIRHQGSNWHEPDTSVYANEKELQELVKLSPTLLPGGDSLAVVDEFWIPGIGFADLVAVGTSGEITIVECKLGSNPGIRREVVGQTLAYAGGLWHMSYDDFAAGFAARNVGISLFDAVSAASGDEVDDVVLREGVTRRLADGEFTLIIAVDSITPELKLIIEYLNTHTLSTVKVLALELAYGKDGDVELLISTVYGEESAERKAKSSATSKWTAEGFLAEVELRTSGPVKSFIVDLLDHGQQYGHHAYYGTGATPGMSYYYTVAGSVSSVWALYLYQGAPKIALSLGSIANKVSVEAAAAFLHALEQDPTLAQILAAVGDAVSTKYPQIFIDPVLIGSETRAAFFAALDLLRDKPASTS